MIIQATSAVTNALPSRAAERLRLNNAALHRATLGSNPALFRVRAAQAPLRSRTPRPSNLSYSVSFCLLPAVCWAGFALSFTPLLGVSFCLFALFCTLVSFVFNIFQPLLQKEVGYGYGAGRQARQIPITRPTFIISKLRTLVLLFKPLTLYFQQVPNSFAKNRGVVQRVKLRY